MIRRWLPTIARVSSLLLFAATLTVWITSHQTRPDSWLLREWGDDKTDTACTFEIYDGVLRFWTRTEPHRVQEPAGANARYILCLPRGPKLDGFGMQCDRCIYVASADGKRLPSVDGGYNDYALRLFWILFATGVLPGWWLLKKIELRIQRQLALRRRCSPHRFLRLCRPINALTFIALLLFTLTIAAWLIGSSSDHYRITLLWAQKKSEIYIAIRGIGVNSHGIFWADLHENFWTHDKTETLEGLQRYLAQFAPPRQSRTFWDSDFARYASPGGSYTSTGDKHQVDFKLLLAAFAALPAARPLWNLLLWAKRIRRHPASSCATCGYSLTANTSGVCPQCGSPVPKSA